MVQGCAAPSVGLSRRALVDAEVATTVYKPALGARLG